MTDQGPQPTESSPSTDLPSTTSPSGTAPPVDSAAIEPAETPTEGPLAAAEPAVRQIQEQYRYSDEAREALLGSILRMVDEHRFGHRELSTEEVRDLAEAWSALNDGLTGTEVGYNWTIRRLHARRSESRRHD
jgi:hypothetical protein